MERNRTNIFLSYCRADSKIADRICNYFEDRKDVKIHRDKKDIHNWDSIKEYMRSIDETEYAILLISDVYLKSPNCKIGRASCRERVCDLV